MHEPTRLYVRLKLLIAQGIESSHFVCLLYLLAQHNLRKISRLLPEVALKITSSKFSVDGQHTAISATACATAERTRACLGKTNNLSSPSS